MISFGFLAKINSLTRYAKKSASLIDQIYVRNRLPDMIDQTSMSGILHTAISDHFGIFTTHRFKTPKSTPRYVVIHKQDQAALNAFKNAISSENILSKIRVALFLQN